MNLDRLITQAQALRMRLSDLHNACFVDGMPLPGTAATRARLRAVLNKARHRYIRRLVRDAMPGREQESR